MSGPRGGVEPPTRPHHRQHQHSLPRVALQPPGDYGQALRQGLLGHLGMFFGVERNQSSRILEDDVPLKWSLWWVPCQRTGGYPWGCFGVKRSSKYLKRMKALKPRALIWGSLQMACVLLIPSNSSKRGVSTCFLGPQTKPV